MEQSFLKWFYVLLLVELAVTSDDKYVKLLGDTVRVPDSAFSASSYYKEDYRPEKVRASEGDQDRVWCPKPKVGRALEEYIEINLGTLCTITHIVTKGRFGAGSGTELVPFYFVKYRREENSKWIDYRKLNGDKKIVGNTDTHMDLFTSMNPGFVAQWIRIYPYSENLRRVCLSLQFFGRYSTSHLIEYRIPKYNTLSPTLQDTTYDGKYENGMLVGGLGKLADHDSIKFKTVSTKSWDADGESPTGGLPSFYVGWRKSWYTKDSIDMVFRFDSVRRFRQMSFKANNNFNLQIRLFRRIEVRFSVGCRYFNRQTPVVANITSDNRMKATRMMQPIDLKQSIGRCIQVKLFFAGDWIVLKEVNFESDPVLEAVTTESPYSGSADTTRINQLINGDTVTDLNTNPGGNRYESQVTYILVIICCLLGAVIFCGLLVCVCLRRKRVQRKKKQLNNNNHTLNVPVQAIKTSNGMIQIDLNSHSHQPTMTINGKLVNDNSIYTSLPGSDTESNGAASDFQYSCALNSMKRPGSDRSTISPEYASASMIGTGAFASPPPPYIGNTNLISNPTAEYMDRFRTYLETAVRQTPGSTRVQHALPQPPVALNYPAPVTIQGKIPKRVKWKKGFLSGKKSRVNTKRGAGNTVYIPPRDLDLATPLDQLDIAEIPRRQLYFLEKLGGGYWGEVHLAELKGAVDPPNSAGRRSHQHRGSPPPPRQTDTGTTSGGSEFEDEEAEDLVHLEESDSSPQRLPAGATAASSETTLVAVKMLRKDASEQSRRDFLIELRVLARISNPYVARLLGICSEDGHLCIISEYLRYGDLHQFLQGHYSADLCNNIHPLPPNTRTLSYGALIYMAVQMASGMKYLESLGIVHRDLACRNCLVGTFYRIKISDLGMSRRLYSTDYFRVEGRAILPIRWMAWESILQGRFSSKTDVWSFAVCLWEVLTFCREQPFQHLSDEQVIVHAGLVAAGDPRAESLTAPPACPKEIWDLMVECWNRNDVQRPSFREIHMFLQRKNLGFDPREETVVTGMTVGRNVVVASNPLLS